jgi:2-oxoglutarate dehydrogenase E1 component
MFPVFRRKCLDLKKIYFLKNSRIPTITHFSNLFHKNISKPYISITDPKESFVNGESAEYLENMYNMWRKDKNLVDKTWDEYFSALERIDSFREQNRINQPLPYQTTQVTPEYLPLGSTQPTSSSAAELNKVNLLIRSYQRNGYLNANLDPLDLDLIDRPESHHIVQESRQTLDYKNYGFSEQDLEKEFVIYTPQISGILSETRPLKFRDIIERLNKAYCGTIGPDYMYMSSREECNFMREKFENEWVNYKATKNEKISILDRMAWAVLFEEFIHKKFTTHKRFGLEGLESLISGLKWLVDISVSHGVKDITLGMAHRGRLNVLANVMRKPISKIFAEFQGKAHLLNQTQEEAEIDYIQTGDVKYHLGTFHERVYSDGKTITMDLLPNPSHLEAVNPVVVGKTRAKQHFNNDEERTKYMAILIHGDASFSGQGVVYESMQMENLDHYKVGGVIHVIANNQIGFTTNPKDGRSTPFVSDLLKAYEAPIIHVNADDPIAVDYSFKVAAEYQLKFKKSIAIDIIGYRKFGHNELDQPFFTQPQMYKAIANKENVLKMYSDRIIQEGVLSKEECDVIISDVTNKLEQCYKNAENNIFEKSEWVSKQWQHLYTKKYSSPQLTGINHEKLLEINEKVNLLPNDMNIHKTIKKIYENRYNTVKEGTHIDMATSEALCFGSLLDEGYTVRLSGQDVERGTFSHRHSVLHDQDQNRAYIPLCNIPKNPKNFQPCNSHLSEFAVLGFELGFSYYNPEALVIWEAQFGDFANNAQAIIDQFIASGESKWNIQSGLVLNLPHGMDGQGPEHSSARIERFLQMMDDDINDISDLDQQGKVTQIQESNYQVCYPTTSANYFHLLRRQLKREFRKPLILAMSKKLLKFKLANSNIEDFINGTKFVKVRNEFNERIINNKKNVKMILVCSGQIYYDLILHRQELKREDVAIIAVEQIGPFPYLEFLDSIQNFPNARITWVQEEHVNQGAWEYVRSRINNLLKIVNRGGELSYVGRLASCAPSTGFHDIFEKEHKKLLHDAFNY